MEVELSTTSPVIRTSGSSFIGPDGEPLILRGVCLGGWLNMENFITGYSAQRVADEDRGAAGHRRRPGRALLRSAPLPLLRRRRRGLPGRTPGFNLARIAVGYKHFEDDARPFEIKADGFRHLDRAIEALARHGVYSIVDLHALPGSQNQHWHSDNPTHIAAFWQHRHFQDRVVHLWEAIAEHYRGNPWVAGYNLLNEPSDESRKVVGPFYRRLVTAIRAVDPDHIRLPRRQHLRDRVRHLRRAVRERRLHAARLRAGRPGPQSRTTAARRRSRSSCSDRRTRARPARPILVGEFGPIYTGDEAQDARAARDPRRPARPLPTASGQLGAVDVQGHRSPGTRLGASGHPLPAPVRRLRGEEEPARRRPVGQRRDRRRPR